LLLYFTPWYLFILPVNIALIVGIGIHGLAGEDDRGSLGGGRRSSGQLADEGADRLADLGVVDDVGGIGIAILVVVVLAALAIVYLISR
jgi:hypothetical protein